jgi:hypothetical protein
MNEPDHQFRVVLRGYDPTDVDRVISELQQRAAKAEASTADVEASTAETQRVISGLQQRAVKAEASATALEARLKDARKQAAAASAADTGPKGPLTFEHLGERVAKILGLADEEAKDLRDRAQAEAEETRKLADQAALVVRDEADQYADQRRRDADTEGDRILADARRAADEERDAAERDAAARRQEGEAVFEQQRADAARAAADFETTLAERRDRTTAEFTAQQASTQAQLESLAQQVEETRAAAQQEQEAAEAQARRIVLDAEERAATLIREARATADRVRTDSERELTAATQRRDSINAQLSNVRQMLATLSGSAVGYAVEPLPDVEEPALAVVAEDPPSEVDDPPSDGDDAWSEAEGDDAPSEEPAQA